MAAKSTAAAKERSRSPPATKSASANGWFLAAAGWPPATAARAPVAIDQAPAGSSTESKTAEAPGGASTNVRSGATGTSSDRAIWPSFQHAPDRPLRPAQAPAVQLPASSRSRAAQLPLSARLSGLSSATRRRTPYRRPAVLQPQSRPERAPPAGPPHPTRRLSLLFYQLHQCRALTPAKRWRHLFGSSVVLGAGDGPAVSPAAAVAPVLSLCPTGRARPPAAGISGPTASQAASVAAKSTVLVWTVEVRPFSSPPAFCPLPT